MVRIAAYQSAPALALEERKMQLQNILAKAHLECIDFLCFPEGFLTGYYTQDTLARENSLEIGGTVFKEWLDVIKDSKTTIIIGFNERAGNLLFDSAAIIENGKLLGIQRKHYLYHTYFTPGSSFLSFQSKDITFGVAICLDMNYFEPARLLALQGTTILFSPMCNRVSPNHPYAKRPSYYSHFVARSFENRCWLVTADWIWPQDGTSFCPGHSVIYNPDGQEVARSEEGKEQLLIFDIPRDQLLQEKGRRVYGSFPLAQEVAKLSLQEAMRR